MGFWHTGYIEFHEPNGLGPEWFQPGPVVYPCSICDQEFATPEAQRKHRFEDHPVQRPVLLLSGREVGIQSLRMTSRLSPVDVVIINAETASFNDKMVPVTDLPMLLAQQSSGFARIGLAKAGTSAEFNLEFQIADPADLEGVEQQFLALSSRATLDLQSIENFISGSERYPSARIYLGGICNYLYGILAKERSKYSNLSYDSHISRFTKAVQELDGYDRPLARSICALIEFQFNHFQESYSYSPASRVGLAARRFKIWLNSDSGDQLPDFRAPMRHTIDSLLTDPDTEMVLQWSTTTVDRLVLKIEEMLDFLSKDIGEYDRKKVNVLVAEAYCVAGKNHDALKIARSLRNLSVFEGWAESIISAEGRPKDDRI